MWPKFANLRWLLALLAITVMFSALVGNVIWAQDASTDTPTPTTTFTPTDVPTSTPTQVPTDTPLPTATDTEIPTAAPTDVPTSTPTVVPTNTPTATDAPVIGLQDPASPTPTTASPTTSAPLTVTGSEPAQITAGQSATLSVIGTNFTKSTSVRLIGFGFLTTTFVNTGALTAALPASLPAGQYAIQVTDPDSGSANSPNNLTVNAVAATAGPTTTTIPTATSTTTPTPVPGQPKLVVANFSANPSLIYPGGTTQLTFVVQNVGSRDAQGVVVSLGDTKFVPANGQASVTLPDLPAGASVMTTLAVNAPSDAAEGPQSIAITLTSHDFSGQSYNDSATLSVSVAAADTGTSQVVLNSYTVSPTTAAPGDNVTVQAVFKNSGTDGISQVMVQLDSSSGLLIAGSQGDTFTIGDMLPDGMATLTMPLVVASTAKDGAQSQALKISYMQGSTSESSSASLSLTVATVATPSPLLLLQSYSTGQDDALQPGQQFTFQMSVQNAGSVDVSNLMVTFGTVATSSGTGSTNATQTSPTTSTTTASSDFAIFGSGGTVLVGDLAAGKSVSVSQAFLVSSDLTSGIHSLPITLQYQTSDGTTSQQSLSASLLVVVPARVRITQTNTLADSLTAGAASTLALKISNLGSSEVALTDMTVTADNATITTGAKAALDPLQSDDDTTETVSFTPKAAGAYTITVKVDYLDDLNQTQTVTQTYSGQVTAAAAQTNQRTFTPPGQQNQNQNQNELGRLLLGFLGFGG